MANQQKSQFTKLGKFSWEQSTEQAPTTTNQQRPKYQMLGRFTWEQSHKLDSQAMFNDKALKRKYKTESGATKALDYREPCIGPSTGTPAAPPPTGEGWHWLTGDKIRNSNPLESTEGFVPTLKRIISKGKPPCMKDGFPERASCYSGSEQSAESTSLSSLSSDLSSNTQVTSGGAERTSRPSTADTAIAPRPDALDFKEQSLPSWRLPLMWLFTKEK